MDANNAGRLLARYTEFVASADVIDDGEMTTSHEALEEQTQREHGALLRISSVHVSAQLQPPFNPSVTRAERGRR